MYPRRVIARIVNWFSDLHYTRELLDVIVLENFSHLHPFAVIFDTYPGFSLFISFIFDMIFFC